MSSEAKKYRRTKRVVQHANPLFDSWLLEWQQEAEKRGSNMKYNFQRARKSLSLYPLPLYTGQDCKLLANFGNKICQMLDKRLAQHEEEFGTTDWTEIHKIKGTPRKRVKKKASTATAAAIPTASTAADRTRKPHTPQSSKEPGNEDSQRKRRSKSKSPYIPLVRSGAYAMLMTLYQASLHPQYKGFMKKDEVIEAAQPLCDASLQKPDKVGSYYSAWSSMATLVRKGLVLRYSHPPKFSITEEGKALAVKLDSAERSIDVMEDAHPPPTADEQSSSHPIQTHTLSSSDDDNEGDDDVDDDGGKVESCSPASSTLDLTQSPQLREEEEEESDVQEEAVSSWSVSRKDHLLPGHHSPQNSSASPSGGLRFSYVTPLDMETPLKDSAGVTVEEDGFLGFLIKCGASELQESGLHYRLDHTRTARAGLVYAYLSNECAPDQCIGLNKAAAGAAPPPTPPPPPPPSTSKKQSKAKPRRNGLSHLPTGSKATVAPPHKTRTVQPHIEAIIEPFSITPPAPACTAAVTPASSYVPFTLLPENYEIILCIDIAETSGKSAEAQPSNKDVILSELKRNGVKYSIRKLHVGDYLWVCQETRPTLATSHGTSAKDVRELVLPVVVERKRMDDLASSIRDGRFKEQKFRLQQCGLSHPVYLVEEDRGSVSAGLSMPETNCLQAVVNTQVINGFTVKVVKGQRESAAYLTIMTRYLQSKYQNKTIRSAQLQDLDGNQTNLHSQTETNMLSFSEFNAASMKNQQLTVREMFAKHLMQLYGVSADKARAVVDKYGTPSLLMTAYEEEATTEGAKKLLAGLKWGKAGRSLGPVLSANIANLYTAAVLQ